MALVTGLGAKAPSPLRSAGALQKRGASCLLAVCEFAGAGGLLIGIAWPPVGLAAAVGLILYFLGAIIAQVRVGDLKGTDTPAMPLGLAVACLVTRILSAYRG